MQMLPESVIALQRYRGVTLVTLVTLVMGVMSVTNMHNFLFMRSCDIFYTYFIK